MSINGISSNLPSVYTNELASTTQKAATDAPSLEKNFGQVLNSLSATQNTSDDLITQMALGENVDVHDATIAAAETEVNFKIALGIRDRLVDAYKEIMRMSV